MFHLGSTNNSGHYIAYRVIHDSEKGLQFRCFNDSFLDFATFDDVTRKLRYEKLRLAAYVLDDADLFFPLEEFHAPKKDINLKAPIPPTPISKNAKRRKNRRKRKEAREPVNIDELGEDVPVLEPRQDEGQCMECKTLHQQITTLRSKLEQMVLQQDSLQKEKEALRLENEALRKAYEQLETQRKIEDKGTQNSKNIKSKNLGNKMRQGKHKK